MTDETDTRDDDGARAPGPLEQLGRKLDEIPELRRAEEAVLAAREEFEKSLRYYQEVREQTVEKMKKLRDQNLGDVVDGVLESVHKHPGRGVIVSFLIGMLFGRLFRR